MERFIEMRSENFPSFSLFRLAALSLILITTIFLRQEVMGVEVVIKVYAVSCVSFFLSAVGIIFWREVQKIQHFMHYQIFYDILLTSYLIFHTGINESIFLFLYILNIIYAAIAYQMIGALAVAFIAGTTYGAIYYINKDTSQDSHFYTLFYNELFFLLTALLSGQLMDELKRQANLLRNEREEVDRLRLLTDRLINHLPSGILQVDEDNYVVSVNKIAIELFGIAKLPSHRVQYFELVPELADMRSKWFNLSEPERLKFSFALRRNGRERVLSLQVVFLPPTNSTDTAAVQRSKSRTDLIFVVQDISKLQELEGKLQLESKLAAIGQLAAGIAHEIRTPLASISGSIETLLKNIKPTNPDDEKLVNISLKEIRRLDRLITEFLIFVRPISNDLQPVVLRKLVDEVVTAISNIKNASVSPKFEIIMDSSLEVKGDPEKLKQVFLNIFTNSIEASTKESVQIRVVAKVDGDRVRIVASDDGCGISKENQEKIFNPFFTTKRSGTGLGLANVAQIVRSHGGEIRVLPSAQGASFEFSLPLIAAAATVKIGA